jgi:hypothetical protein
MNLLKAIFVIGRRVRGFLFGKSGCEIGGLSRNSGFFLGFQIFSKNG